MSEGNGREQADLWHCRWNDDHKVRSLQDLYAHESSCPDRPRKEDK